ncbi:hypothetical protein UPYG_G00054850 [Umbra pygmaea]|uniref:Uncharacterized protein n=1 Tax=Umbra pygmaea TaxID=75934 RepID=A0ABD0X803_UMBPY
MALRESDGESLQAWLNKATDPSNGDDRWDCIQGFYELINMMDDGPQVASRLLAHKIQSPQPTEALQALTVLEACMNNCGKRFHNEATKFRFLNELIKVLSPKHLGQWSTPEVKRRITEVLYSWTLWLKDEPKLQEAYNMLKKQGVVKKDPVLPDIIIMPPPSQRAEDSVFDQEDKAQMLARLLQSNRPEDLQTANRLIKNTIKEEQEKADRVSRRISTLQEVASSTQKLRDLLQQHQTETQHTDDLKSLYEDCDRFRPSLFRLASDTINDDESLAQILQANDELTLVLNMYKETVLRANKQRKAGGGKQDASTINGPASPSEIRTYHLIDLTAVESSHTAEQSPPHSSSSSSSGPASRHRLNSTLISLADLDVSGLDNQGWSQKQSPRSPSRSPHDDLVQLTWGQNQTRTDHYLTMGGDDGRDHILKARGCGSASSNGKDWASSQNLPRATSQSQSKSQSQPIVMSGCSSNSQSQPIAMSGCPSKSQSQPIAMSGCPSKSQSRPIVMSGCSSNSQSQPIAMSGCPSKSQSQPIAMSGCPSKSQSQPIAMSGCPSKSQSQSKTEAGSPIKSESLILPESLTDVHVPLESIRPSRLEPITVHNKNGILVSLHFAQAPPPGYPEVAVVIVSTVNTSALPVKDFLFQAAVPKTMTVKLQPSSGKDLPPYNPLLPPGALSQILLLSNPHRRKVRLRYRLTMVHGASEQRLCETGEIDNFPEWMSWIGMEIVPEPSGTSQK